MASPLYLLSYTSLAIPTSPFIYLIYSPFILQPLHLSLSLYMSILIQSVSPSSPLLSSPLSLSLPMTLSPINLPLPSPSQSLYSPPQTAMDDLKVTRFICKIGEKNTPSLNMFWALNYSEVHRSIHKRFTLFYF